MKRLSLRLTIALATFFIGVGIVALWFFNRSNSVVDVEPKPHDCYPLYVDNFDASDYKGVFTRRVYAINANKTRSAFQTKKQTPKQPQIFLDASVKLRLQVRRRMLMKVTV
jgi:hypothetical protein